MTTTPPTSTEPSTAQEFSGRAAAARRAKDLGESYAARRQKLITRYGTADPEKLRAKFADLGDVAAAEAVARFEERHRPRIHRGAAERSPSAVGIPAPTTAARAFAPLPPTLQPGGRPTPVPASVAAATTAAQKGPRLP